MQFAKDVGICIEQPLDRFLLFVFQMVLFQTFLCINVFDNTATFIELLYLIKLFKSYEFISYQSLKYQVK